MGTLGHKNTCRSARSKEPERFRVAVAAGVRIAADVAAAAAAAAREQLVVIAVIAAAVLVRNSAAPMGPVPDRHWQLRSDHDPVR